MTNLQADQHKMRANNQLEMYRRTSWASVSLDLFFTRRSVSRLKTMFIYNERGFLPTASFVSIDENHRLIEATFHARSTSRCERSLSLCMKSLSSERAKPFFDVRKQSEACKSLAFFDSAVEYLHLDKRNSRSNQLHR